MVSTVEGQAFFGLIAEMNVGLWYMEKADFHQSGRRANDFQMAALYSAESAKANSTR